jgi:predicted ArsR family transcriptional regulator
VSSSAVRSARGHELTGPQTMRAVAHRVRVALLEALTKHRSLTATQAADLVHESPSTCSFHLRQLAKYGFVEEVGGGAGRQRPWRLTRMGTLVPALLGRYVTRQQAWLQSRAGLPDEWQEVTGHSEFLLYITPEELRMLDAEVTALLRRYASRIANPSLRPPGSRPIEVLFFAFPFVREPDR